MFNYWIQWNDPTHHISLFTFVAQWLEHLPLIRSESYQGHLLISSGNSEFREFYWVPYCTQFLEQRWIPYIVQCMHTMIHVHLIIFLTFTTKILSPQICECCKIEIPSHVCAIYTSVNTINFKLSELIVIICCCVFIRILRLFSVVVRGLTNNVWLCACLRNICR